MNKKRTEIVFQNCKQVSDVISTDKAGIETQVLKGK